MELTIQSVKATGEITKLYAGNFDIKAIGAELLNPITFTDVQVACQGAKLEYKYNNDSSDNKKKEVAQQLGALKLLLGFTTIAGIIDNTLDKAGITRTSDIRAKFHEMMPNAPETVIDECMLKFDTVQTKMAEVNDWLKQYRPSGLPDGEQYYFRHHFPSPKSIQRKTTEQTN